MAHHAFRLFNTHSLPLEDMVSRETTSLEVHTIDTSLDVFTVTPDDILKISYGPADTPFLTHQVLRNLKNPMDDQAVIPRHHLANGSDAPFFYWDSRHVFYVTTEEAIKRPNRWGGYYESVEQDSTVVQIPPMVSEKKLLPSPIPIELFVSEDAYINKWIATGGLVQYGDVGIGPAGGLHGQP
jgi:hypothetical protein